MSKTGQISNTTMKTRFANDVFKLERVRNVTKEMKMVALCLCVITAPRENNTSYIHDVLLSIQQDMRPGMNVSVLVVDVSQSDRADLLAAQRAFPRFAFQRLANKTDEHCPLGDPSAHLGRVGNISCSVRQQTRDVAAALRQCAAAANRTGWLLLVEDDTPLCQGGLPEILTVTVLDLLTRLAAAAGQRGLAVHAGRIGPRADPARWHHPPSNLVL